MAKRPKKTGGYSPHHPWYYYLGGVPPDPDQIVPDKPADQEYNQIVPRLARADRGEQIANAIVVNEEALDGAIRRYRDLVERGEDALDERSRHYDEPGKCNAVHSALSMAYNHIYYHKAVLWKLYTFLAPDWTPGDPLPHVMRRASTPSLLDASGPPSPGDRPRAGRPSAGKRPAAKA